MQRAVRPKTVRSHLNLLRSFCLTPVRGRVPKPSLRSSAEHLMAATASSSFGGLGLSSSAIHTMVDLSKAKVTGYAPLPDPKWVQTNLINYTDPNGKARDWEFCSRRTRIEGAEADGVGIIAVLKKATGPEILLQRQFRPPVNGVCIEIPAGLLDPNETLEACAERELKEETGFVGKATRSSPVIFNDPGFCNTNLKVVHVDIDLTDPRNQNPIPQLEENEFIETFSVPLKSLPEEVSRLAKEGFAIDARVANIADGIELARSLNL